MESTFTLPGPGLKPLDLLTRTTESAKPTSANQTQTKARAAAQDFEAVFLNSMFQHMFTNMGGEGPFGGSGAVGVWRSMLTDEYAKSFAKSGGIGIASQVYRTLMAQQEVRS